MSDGCIQYLCSLITETSQHLGLSKNPLLIGQLLRPGGPVDLQCTDLLKSWISRAWTCPPQLGGHLCPVSLGFLVSGSAHCAARQWLRACHPLWGGWLVEGGVALAKWAYPVCCYQLSGFTPCSFWGKCSEGFQTLKGSLASPGHWPRGFACHRAQCGDQCRIYRCLRLVSQNIGPGR